MWDILFPRRTDGMGDYLNSEGSDEDMPEIGSSAQIEVITQRDETEDVKTLETSEAPVENIPLSVVPIKTPASRFLPLPKFSQSSTSPLPSLPLKLPKVK